MGYFYGDRVNVLESGFSTDRVFPNRFSMDLNVDTDGVMVGKLVLINYNDPNTAPIPNPNSFPVPNGYEPDVINAGEHTYKFKKIGTQGEYLVDIVKNSDIIKYKNNELEGATFKYYKCSSPNVLGYAVFYEYDNIEEIAGYTNYTDQYIDQIHYRVDNEEDELSFNNTVWIKQYDETGHKYEYVLIANLNSTIPTFAVDLQTSVSTIDNTQDVYMSVNITEFEQGVNYYIWNAENEEFDPVESGTPFDSAQKYYIEISLPPSTLDGKVDTKYTVGMLDTTTDLNFVSNTLNISELKTNKTRAGFEINLQWEDLITGGEING